MKDEAAHDPTTSAHTPIGTTGCGMPRPDSGHGGPHLVSVLGVRAPVVASGGRDERVRTVAEAQRGLITRGQLRAAGLTDTAVARMVSRGQLSRRCRSVYSVGPRLDVPLARETAALLACAPGTVLAYRSAGVLWDLLEAHDGPVDVLIAGRETGRPAGVTVHRTRHLEPADIRVRHYLPVTSPARTLLDLADVLEDRDLERALDAGLVHRVVRRGQLANLLGRTAGRRGAPRLRALLERGATTVTRSQAEERFLALVRAAGLPEPLVNARIHGFEVDFLWPRERVVVEIDGFQFHGSRQAFERDRRKSAVLTAAGMQVLRATWLQMDAGSLALVASVAQTLARAA